MVWTTKKPLQPLNIKKVKHTKTQFFEQTTNLKQTHKINKCKNFTCPPVMVKNISVLSHIPNPKFKPVFEPHHGYLRQLFNTGLNLRQPVEHPFIFVPKKRGKMMTKSTRKF